MNFNYQPFSLHGRISRKTYWWGLLILAVLNFVLIAVLMKFLGITKEEVFGNEIRNKKTWHLYFLTLLIIPTFPLMVKRLHDLNKSAYWLIPVIGLNFTFNIMQYLDIAGSRHHPTTLFLIIVILALNANLLLIYELGFKRGTQGDNRYGQDPIVTTWDE